MNATHQVQTDSAQRINLDSHIVYATWLGHAAYGGCNAQLEIVTTFVSDGSQVKIKCRSEGGRTLANFETQIFGNKLIAEVPIPARIPVGERAYCTVKLPRHGLDIESNAAILRPPLVVSRMQWSAQEARRGDLLTLTTQFDTDIPDGADALVIIYEYDRDGRHDPIVKIPTTVANRRVEVQWEFEYFDTSLIPTQPELQPHNRSYAAPQFFFVVVLDGVRVGVGQESGLVKFKDGIGLLVVVDEHADIAGKKFELHCADGSIVRGTVASDGTIAPQDVPPGSINVVFPDAMEYEDDKSFNQQLGR